jgi:hypothetical protein
MSLSFRAAKQVVESIVAHALLRAASALLPTSVLVVAQLWQESVYRIANNISHLKCLALQKLSGIGQECLRH